MQKKATQKKKKGAKKGKITKNNMTHSSSNDTSEDKDAQAKRLDQLAERQAKIKGSGADYDKLAVDAMNAAAKDFD